MHKRALAVLLVRAARARRRMTQQDLAVAAGVSRRWIVDLEAGKPRAELGLVLRVLSTLGIPLTADAPEAPTRSDSVSAQGFDPDAHLHRLRRTIKTRGGARLTERAVRISESSTP